MTGEGWMTSHTWVFLMQEKGMGGLHVRPLLSQELEDIDPGTSVSPSHPEVTLAPQQIPSGTNPPASAATHTEPQAPSRPNARSFNCDHAVCLFVLAFCCWPFSPATAILHSLLMHSGLDPCFFLCLQCFGQTLFTIQSKKSV